MKKNGLFALTGLLVLTVVVAFAASNQAQAHRPSTTVVGSPVLNSDVAQGVERALQGKDATIAHLLEEKQQQIFLRRKAEDKVEAIKWQLQKAAVENLRKETIARQTSDFYKKLWEEDRVPQYDPSKTYLLGVVTGVPAVLLLVVGLMFLVKWLIKKSHKRSHSIPRRTATG